VYDHSESLNGFNRKLKSTRGVFCDCRRVFIYLPVFLKIHQLARFCLFIGIALPYHSDCVTANCQLNNQIRDLLVTNFRHKLESLFASNNAFINPDITADAGPGTQAPNPGQPPNIFVTTANTPTVCAAMVK